MNPMAYYEYFGSKTVAALKFETFFFENSSYQRRGSFFLTSRGGGDSFAAGMDMSVLKV